MKRLMVTRETLDQIFISSDKYYRSSKTQKKHPQARHIPTSFRKVLHDQLQLWQVFASCSQPVRVELMAAWACKASLDVSQTVSGPQELVRTPSLSCPLFQKKFSFSQIAWLRIYQESRAVYNFFQLSLQGLPQTYLNQVTLQGLFRHLLSKSFTTCISEHHHQLNIANCKRCGVKRIVL